MGGSEHHTKIASENWLGASRELRARRFSNVGLLSIKALEQAIESCAAREGLHFHDEPATAHARRKGWLKKNHPDLVQGWDTLWNIYGILGYGGSDGKNARLAIQTVRSALGELKRREKIAIRGL